VRCKDIGRKFWNIVESDSCDILWLLSVVEWWWMVSVVEWWWMVSGVG